MLILVGVKKLALFVGEVIAIVGAVLLAVDTKTTTVADVVTAPSFGFEGADHYYGTQSAKNFLADIRVPTLMIQAKDDPFIPFEMYGNPAIAANPRIRLIVTEHGGHLGFLSRRGPRFWIDDVILEFFGEVAGERKEFAFPRRADSY